MAYEKAKIPSEIYHLTKRKNLEQILADGKIKRFCDTECWFCESLPNMKKYMEYTVLQEGKAYFDVGGRVNHYPRFKPENHAILKLTPRYREGNWVRWMQEMPKGCPPELMDKAKEFSNLKIGFRGDLRFTDYEIIDAEDVLNDFEKVCSQEPHMTM